MTCSQWNDMILFLVLCRWSNFKMGTFRQGTTATKCLLAWQMCVALKWNIWILVIKCAFCSVLILGSDQPTNRKAKLFSSHLRVFWLKYRWKLVFLVYWELYMNSYYCKSSLLMNSKKGKLSNFQSCWAEMGSKEDGNLFPCRLRICIWKWNGPELLNPYHQDLTLLHSCRDG